MRISTLRIFTFRYSLASVVNRRRKLAIKQLTSFIKDDVPASATETFKRVM